MSNNSTPRPQVATVKSIVSGYFKKDHVPTAEDLQEAVEHRIGAQLKDGRLRIDGRGRIRVPYQRFDNPQKKIGKGNGKRV